MNEDHEQRIAEAKAFRKFAINELERTKEIAGTYPDVAPKPLQEWEMGGDPLGCDEEDYDEEDDEENKQKFGPPKH